MGNTADKPLDGAGLAVVNQIVNSRLSSKQPKLTGQPGQVVGFNAQGAAQAVQGWSNPNLLLNSDFSRPVNRNGKMEYTNGGYTIDRWKIVGSQKVTLHNGFIRIEGSGESGNYDQIIETEFKNDTVITYSFFILAGNGKIHIRDVDWGFYGYADINGAGLYSVTSTFPAGKILMAQIYPNGDSALDLIAAKVELGPVQTLAHQDADGNWVLNDPPDYDLQYALCSLYSPITGEWVGNQHSNPNLLDNWYFADPVNQRGQTEYTSDGYTIDRWRLGRAEGVSGARAAVSSDGIKILPGNYIRQMQEDPRFEDIELTFSALINDDLFSFTFVWKNSTAYLASPINKGWILAYSGVSKYVHLYNLGGEADDVVKAAKLELGPVQTLAHQDADGNWVLNDPPPNKALERAKCQRYYQPLPQYTSMIVCATNDYEKYFDVIVAGPPMRIQGTVIHPEYIAQSKSGNVVTYSEQTWQHRVRFYSDNTLPAAGSLVEVSQNGCGISADL